MDKNSIARVTAEGYNFFLPEILWKDVMAMNDGVPARILIVDDDPALLEALPETMCLRIPGTIVDTAMSAVEALASITTIDHDVIVTDLVMPGMTGIDLIRKMREVRPWTPMILMSGNPNPQGYALRTRAYGFIQKPIDRDYLIATLRRAIHYSRLSKKAHGRTEDVQKHLDKLSDIQRRMGEHAAKVQSHYAGGKAMASVSESVTSRPSSQS